MPKLKPVKGMKSGRLTATGRDGLMVVCQCECGNTTKVTYTNLKTGNTKSCGCYRKDVATQRATSHGMTGTPEYQSWFAMVQRCTNPNHEYYGIYGGAGVTVCEEWLEFENFFADMGFKPSPEHSLERREVTGNYEPSNCKWATRVEQANNKKNTIRLTYNGKTQTASEWADELGIPRPTVYARLAKGWAVEAVLKK